MDSEDTKWYYFNRPLFAHCHCISAFSRFCSSLSNNCVRSRLRCALLIVISVLLGSSCVQSGEKMKVLPHETRYILQSTFQNRLQMDNLKWRILLFRLPETEDDSNWNVESKQPLQVPFHQRCHCSGLNADVVRFVETCLALSVHFCWRVTINQLCEFFITLTLLMGIACRLHLVGIETTGYSAIVRPDFIILLHLL